MSFEEVATPAIDYAEIGQAYEKLNRKSEALAAYKKGQADDPENAEIKEGLKRTQ